jgi:hypothetical protein
MRQESVSESRRTRRSGREQLGKTRSAIHHHSCGKRAELGRDPAGQLVDTHTAAYRQVKAGSASKALSAVGGLRSAAAHRARGRRTGGWPRSGGANAARSPVKPGGAYNSVIAVNVPSSVGIQPTNLLSWRFLWRTHEAGRGGARVRTGRSTERAQPCSGWHGRTAVWRSGDAKQRRTKVSVS